MFLFNFSFSFEEISQFSNTHNQHNFVIPHSATNIRHRNRKLTRREKCFKDTQSLEIWRMRKTCQASLLVCYDRGTPRGRHILVCVLLCFNLCEILQCQHTSIDSSYHTKAQSQNSRRMKAVVTICMIFFVSFSFGEKILSEMRIRVSNNLSTQGDRDCAPSGTSRALSEVTPPVTPRA